MYSGAWPIPTVGPTCLIHVFSARAAAEMPLPALRRMHGPQRRVLWKATGWKLELYTVHYRYYRLYLSDPFLVFQDQRKYPANKTIILKLAYFTAPPSSHGSVNISKLYHTNLTQVDQPQQHRQPGPY